MAKTNPGKAFEQDWKNSLPLDAVGERLKDAGGWAAAKELRFTIRNPFDFILYRYPIFFALELKSTGGTSLRWDALQPHQERGLSRVAPCRGVVSGVVVNFRKYARTFFIPISGWKSARGASPKKSFNESEAEEMGVEIAQERVRTRFRYDIESFINYMGTKIV